MLLFKKKLLKKSVTLIKFFKAYNFTGKQKIAFFLNEKKSVNFWITAGR